MRANAVVLVLSRNVWADTAVVSALSTAVSVRREVALVHEADEGFGGEPVFNAIMHATPENLTGLYSSMAVPISRGAGEEARLLARLLPKIGCDIVGPPLLPPPPLPAGYKEAATAAPYHYDPHRPGLCGVPAQIPPRCNEL